VLAILIVMYPIHQEVPIIHLIYQVIGSSDESMNE